MKAEKRPIAANTALEKILSRLADAIGTAEVVFGPGRNMRLAVTTSTGSVLEVVFADDRLHWRCESGKGRASWA